MTQDDRAQFPNEVDADGGWVRQASAFRDRITADGSSGFKAEPGRYHLYVSWACPWSHRTILFRRLKNLEDAIGMTVVDPVRDARGWRFGDDPDHPPDPVNGFERLAEAYAATDPAFDGRVTVPVLWDTETGRIVNNESADIMRMMNAEFNALPGVGMAPDLYPPALRAEIDAVNARVYDTVNDGVYKAGFATRQTAYDRAFDSLFESLDWLDRRLSDQRWLVGNRLTEADWRLFVTLVRFDTAYYVHFKCNLRRVVDYPNLWPYLRDLAQRDSVLDTIRLDEVKRHYYLTHDRIDPTGIVPRGPALDLTEPHDREDLGPPDAEYVDA